MAVFDKIPYALHVCRVITLILSIVGVSLFLILFILATIGLNASTLFGDFVLGHGGHFFMWASALFVFDGLLTERILVVYAIMYAATGLGDLATCIVRSIEVLRCGGSLTCSAVDLLASQIATGMGFMLLLISVSQVVIGLLIKISTHKYMAAVRFIITRGMRNASSSTDVLESEDRVLTSYMRELGIGRRRKMVGEAVITAREKESVVDIQSERTADFLDSDKDE